MRESISQIVAYHANLALHHSGLSMRGLADSVIDKYHALVPMAQRSVMFIEGGDPYAAQRANTKQLERQIDGTVRMAADLVPALTLALPEPYRAQCLAEVVGQFGCLAAPIPHVDPDGQHADAASLMRSSGQALVDLSRVIGTAKPQPADVLKALADLREVQARCMSIAQMLVDKQRRMAEQAAAERVL